MKEGLWEAARCVRPYLSELVGRAAPEVDRAIEEVLNGQHDDDAERRLHAIFESYEGTDAFLERVLEDAPNYRPPQVVTALAAHKGYVPGAGNSSPVRADKFVCPHGDFVWYRPEVGVPTPDCPPPSHGHLQPAEGAGR